MPGSAVAVRVLMFVAAGLALSLALLFAALFGMATAIPEFREGVYDAMAEDGLGAGEGWGLVAAGLGIMGSYGCVSLVLACLLRRRSAVLYALTLAFQALALLTAVAGLLSGAPSNLLYLGYTTAIVILLLVTGTRSYYLHRTTGGG